MPDIDPVAQAKALKRLAVIMVVTGLMIGVGLPALFIVFAIEPALTLWGVDAVWLVALATMIFDFVMAWNFWRRAMVLEQRR
jgi:Na+-driven multidrug efflux pump